jgi:flavin-dependent dehydrogenase
MDRDILILGGGPAGLSTALHLQQLAPELAARTMVLEKAHYPRPKLCAGGLVADAEVILERLGLAVGEVPHVDAVAAHFDFSGKGLRISMPKNHTLRIVRRDEFDNWLAMKVRERGIEIREGVTVKEVRPEADGVTVETDAGMLRALVVVGADGSNGVTRHCILPAAPVYTARVLEVMTPERNNAAGNFETTPEPGSLHDNSHRVDHAYFDFLPILDGIAGYTWDFPTQVKGRPMRCWGIYDTNVLSDLDRAPLKEPLATEMARRGFALGDYEIKGYPIRWFDPFNPLAVPRVILVGDAAGADPLFGEGISMALGYGKVAAGAIRDAFSRGDFTFNGYKPRVMLNPLGQTLLVRWLITYIVYPLRWKWIQILFWRLLKPLVIAIAWVFVLNWAKRTR